MLVLASILKNTLDNLKAENPDFVIVDDEHLMNLHTGVMFHMYDDDFKVSYDDKVIIRQPKFRKEEHDLIWEIKKLMQTPEAFREKMDQYPASVDRARRAFSALYENPLPIKQKAPKLKDPELEEDAVIYEG